MMYGVSLPSSIHLIPLSFDTNHQYDAGVLGGVLLHKPFLDAIGNPKGEYIIPMISSSYSLAACVTALLVSTFAFKVGRRGTVILGCVAAIIGSVIQSTSYSVAQLIVGRICTVCSFLPKFMDELICGRDLLLAVSRGKVAENQIAEVR